MQVRDIMSTSVACCSPETRLPEVAAHADIALHAPRNETVEVVKTVSEPSRPASQVYGH